MPSCRRVMPSTGWNRARAKVEEIRRNSTGARRNARRSELPVGVIESGPAVRLEAERRQALAGHRQVAREHPAQADLAVFGDQALEDDLEPVARLDVAGEVDLPGVDVGEVPGQPLAVGAVELIVLHRASSAS